MNLNIAVAKEAAKFVVGFSVSNVVSSIVKNSLAPVTPAQKAQVMVGSYVLGYMVGDTAEKFVSQKIEDFSAKREENKIRSAK